MSLSWRKKLFLFAISVALIPLAISSFNMVDIIQERLKQDANRELLQTAEQLAEEIDNIYKNNWYAPLDLVRKGVESDLLDGEDKVQWLTTGMETIADIMALTVYFETSPGTYSEAVHAFNESVQTQLQDIFLDPSVILSFKSEEIKALLSHGESVSKPVYIAEIDAWIGGMALPLTIPGAPPAVLATKIRLNNLNQRIRSHPFQEDGYLALLDGNGKLLFEKNAARDSSDRVLPARNDSVIANQGISEVGDPHSDGGKKTRAYYANSRYLKWAVFAEIHEGRAYQTVSKMQWNLTFWIALGLALAVLGVLWFAAQISKPILKIGEAAQQMTDGNFDVQVNYQAKDEIGMLGENLTIMSRSLKESFAKIENQNQELEEYNQTLENRVEARTRELQEKNDELEETLSELKRTQNQLIVQEKLASLGSMTAGIAHEIKNPLNFVNNFSLLSIDLAEELAEELAEKKSQFDDDTNEYINDILTHLKNNAGKIAEHGKRADNIVKSMLAHSRGGSGEMEWANLNPLFEENINLAYHGMRAQHVDFNVKIEKHFDENLGEVMINPQDFSRVLINVINNALYAVYEKKQKLGKVFSPVLSVSTVRTKKNVVIKIRDNGDGIPGSVADKIFTPFFTTKPTGLGTGLGLSISYDIVTQGHQGRMEVNTKAGEFTEFVITLPVKQR